MKASLLRLVPPLFCLLLSAACNRPIGRLFKAQTPHEACADRLQKTGGDKTPAGRQWLYAAAEALNRPLNVRLPYREAGRYDSSRATAAGFRLEAQRGQMVTAIIGRPRGSSLTVYAELWKESGSEKTLLLAADTLSDTLRYHFEEATTCVFRLQPPPGAAGVYTLLLTSGPSFQFPVAGKAARIGSLWGAGRDGGARSHEGIDIFAARGTPALAVAAGRIDRVETTAIGGKVVWLRPEGRPWQVYYAHLDQQLVQPGQEVRAGDTLGLVGNTGNAAHTASHLHFGVYGFGGAVDPLLFVQAGKALTPAPGKLSAADLRPRRFVSGTPYLYLSNDGADSSRRKMAAGTLVYPEARSGDWLRVRLPDSSSGFVKAESLKKAGNEN